MRLALCSMLIRDHFSVSFYSFFFVSDMLLEMEKHMHLYVYICIYSLEIKNTLQSSKKM